MAPVQLPSGLVVHARRRAVPPVDGADFLLALGSGPLPSGPSRVLRWPDFWLPINRLDAVAAFDEVLRRARAGETVEVSCRGGWGRTGTALAGIAIRDGLDPGGAVAWVRRSCHPRAVETPWQAWWVEHRVPRPPG